MIGQNNLYEQVNKLIENDSFPRFSILVGPVGSGKKLFAEAMANKISNIVIHAEDVKISTLKQLINESYKLIDKTVYIISDADDMSLAAKNSLLKVLEEPANQAYWIMTVNNIDNVLPTIRSRGTVFYMQPYSNTELVTIAKLFGISKAEMNLVLDVCDTPGDIALLKSFDIGKFYKFVELVIDNIAEVSGANAFKIANQLALKKDDTGYDLRLFWKLFKANCMKRLLNNLHDDEKVSKYSSGISITTECLGELGISGINKVSLIDAWILAIRKEWL